MTKYYALYGTDNHFSNKNHLLVEGYNKTSNSSQLEMFYMRTKNGILNFWSLEYIRYVTIPTEAHIRTVGREGKDYELYADKVVASKEYNLYDFIIGKNCGFILHQNYLEMYMCNNNLEQCKIMYDYIMEKKLNSYFETTNMFFELLKAINNNENIFSSKLSLPTGYFIRNMSKFIFEYMDKQKDTFGLPSNYKHLLELYNKTRKDIDALVFGELYDEHRNCLIKMAENGYKFTIDVQKCVYTHNNRSQINYSLVSFLSKLMYKIPKNEKYNVVLVDRGSLMTSAVDFKYCVENNINILNINELLAKNPNLLKVFQLDLR